MVLCTHVTLVVGGRNLKGVRLSDNDNTVFVILALLFVALPKGHGRVQLCPSDWWLSRLHQHGGRAELLQCQEVVSYYTCSCFDPPMLYRSYQYIIHTIQHCIQDGSSGLDTDRLGFGVALILM